MVNGVRFEKSGSGLYSSCVEEGLEPGSGVWATVRNVQYRRLKGQNIGLKLILERCCRAGRKCFGTWNGMGCSKVFMVDIQGCEVVLVRMWYEVGCK